MVVSMCTSLLALISLSLLRVPSEPVADHVALGDGNEQDSQDTATPEIELDGGAEIVERR